MLDEATVSQTLGEVREVWWKSKEPKQEVAFIVKLSH